MQTLSAEMGHPGQSPSSSIRAKIREGAHTLNRLLNLDNDLVTIANLEAEDLVQLPGPEGHRTCIRDSCCVVWTPTTAAIPWWARHDHRLLEAMRLPRGTLKSENQPFFPIRTEDFLGSLNFPDEIDVV